MADTQTVYLGLGANMPSQFGDPVDTLAVARMNIQEEIGQIEAASPLYTTAPVPDDGSPWYLNQVLAVMTCGAPHEILTIINIIEAACGRVRSHQNAPRTLDVDILAYGDVVLKDDDLTIPHPRLTERAFVLRPLADIAPAWVHPETGHTVNALMTPRIMNQLVKRYE